MGAKLTGKLVAAMRLAASAQYCPHVFHLDHVVVVSVLSWMTVHSFSRAGPSAADSPLAVVSWPQ